MNPAFIDQMSWEMAEVYGAITDQILINLSRYFPYYKAGMKVPKSAFTYQAAMLAQMGKVNRETVKIIRDGLKGADKALQGVLEQAIINSVKKAEPDLLKAVKQGILNPPSIPVVAPNQMRAFQLYYNQAAGKLNLVNTVMLESTQQAYKATVADIATRIQTTQTALDIATGETITGVSAWNEAVKHGIDRLKAGGITGFIDHGNHHWSAEAYVAMDVRTTAMNTGRAAVWEVNQDFGNDLYLVSYHSGARPLCYDWQNKVISAVNNARDITDIDGNTIHVYAQSETTYGQAAGLFGINCKHYPSPFIPGVSQIHGQPQSEEANAKTYAESQEQRRLERKLREEKRDLAMMKARGVPEEQLKAQQARIKQSSSDIDEFCKQTGRARHRDREAVYTQREFPSKDTYDVKEFTQTQKNWLDAYHQMHGAQQNYMFGEMTPNEPIAPVTPVVPQTPVVPVPRPDNEPDFLKQFKRYDVDSKTDAEKLAQINPNYNLPNEGKKWTYNCQRTVAAQEMVYRGYDVTSMPYVKGDPISASGVVVWDTPQFFWKDPDVKTVPLRSEFMKTVTDAFDGWGDGSRGIVRLQWSSAYGGSGHFIFARRVNGNIIFEDPQSNTVVDIAQKLKLTTTGKNRMWVMRVDNRAVNDKIKFAIKNVGE